MPKQHNAPKIKKRADDGSMNKKRSPAAPSRWRAEELAPLSVPKIKKNPTNIQQICRIFKKI